MCDGQPGCCAGVAVKLNGCAPPIWRCAAGICALWSWVHVVVAGVL